MSSGGVYVQKFGMIVCVEPTMVGDSCLIGSLHVIDQYLMQLEMLFLCWLIVKFMCMC